MSVIPECSRTADWLFGGQYSNEHIVCSLNLFFFSFNHRDTPIGGMEDGVPTVHGL
jgi:hypothetical protein